MPHMPLRGKSFELRAKSIDGEAQPTNLLLDVPRYDFNWQHTYELQTPLTFQNIDQLEFTAVFDNSSGNPFNPNPKEYVLWGTKLGRRWRSASLKSPNPTRENRTHLQMLLRRSESQVTIRAIPKLPKTMQRKNWPSSCWPSLTPIATNAYRKTRQLESFKIMHFVGSIEIPIASLPTLGSSLLQGAKRESVASALEQHRWPQLESNSWQGCGCSKPVRF